MRETIAAAVQSVFGGGQMNIRQRVLRLVLSGSLLTFAAMSVFFVYGMFTMRSELVRQRETLGRSAAGYTENFAAEQAKRRLSEAARTQALYIESKLDEIARDVRYLSEGMRLILTSPEAYPPRALPDPRRETIRSGEPYLHYGPRLQSEGVSARLAGEIRLAANAAEYLVPMARLYGRDASSIFVGSKNGYTVCVDHTADEGGVVNMTEEFLSQYDPRERPWYRAAQSAAGRSRPVFTDLYIGADGPLCLTCALPYYDADGFAGVVGVDCTLKALSGIVETTAVGKTGFSFVLSGAGEVVLSARGEGPFAASAGRRDLRQSGEPTLAEAAERMAAGESGVALVSVGGEAYYLAFTPMKSLGWSFGTLIGREEVAAPAAEAGEALLGHMKEFDAAMGRFFVGLTFGTVVLFAGILCALVFGGARVSKRFVEPIDRLTDGVRQIAGGCPFKKIDIRTGDEIERLADGFNAMTDELQTYMEHLTRVTAEKERIATELSVAARIQSGMLPNTFPPYPNRDEFDIFALMRPAKEVGGDFYDFYLLDETHLAVTIADVSGKGVPAALFMVIAKTVLKNCVMLSGADRLAEAAARANDQLCRSNDESMFVTVFLGVLDTADGTFTFVNGGHNPPLLRSGGTFSRLRLPKSCMLGAAEGMTYRARRLSMKPGDLLFLYTDGVTEAQNAAGGMYSEARLLDILNRAPSAASAASVLSAVEESVRAYAGEAEPFDDVTMLGLLYQGRGRTE